jgi:hypothetical protein
MDETEDEIAPYIDRDPDMDARIAKARKIRKAMGIYGRGGQSARGVLVASSMTTRKQPGG